MTTVEQPAQAKTTPPATGSLAEATTDNLRLDWVLTITSAWIITGLYWDGWAHFSGKVDSFFTPWHAVLYSGFAAAGTVLLITQVRNMSHGLHWRRALPDGYLLSLLGVGLFGLAGVADLGWHEIFGFEEDLEALLSPSHLALASGGVLLIGGPLRAAWRRSGVSSESGWRSLGPAILSLFLLLSIFSFFTQFSNAFSNPDVFIGNGPGQNSYFWDVTGISYVLIPAGLWTSFILLALARWHLPPGSLVLLLSGNATMMFLLHFNRERAEWIVVLAALAGGLLAEGWLSWLKPSYQRRAALQWFSFLTTSFMFLFYFLALRLTYSIWWSIHMWLGAVFLAGITAWSLSYVVVPPALPEDR